MDELRMDANIQTIIAELQTISNRYKAYDAVISGLSHISSLENHIAELTAKRNSIAVEVEAASMTLAKTADRVAELENLQDEIKEENKDFFPEKNATTESTERI